MIGMLCTWLGRVGGQNGRLVTTVGERRSSGGGVVDSRRCGRPLHAGGGKSPAIDTRQNLGRFSEQTLGSATEVSQPSVQKIWNSLPSALGQPGLSFAVFKQHRNS